MRLLNSPTYGVRLDLAKRVPAGVADALTAQRFWIFMQEHNKKCFVENWVKQTINQITGKLIFPLIFFRLMLEYKPTLNNTLLDEI